MADNLQSQCFLVVAAVPAEKLIKRTAFSEFSGAAYLSMADNVFF